MRKRRRKATRRRSTGSASFLSKAAAGNRAALAAESWYAQGGGGRRVEAQHALARSFWRKKGSAEAAFAWFLKSANRGHVPAQRRGSPLSKFTREGSAGRPRTPLKLGSGGKKRRKAATRERSTARGRLIKGGLFGVAKDAAHAFDLYGRSAKQGDARAAYASGAHVSRRRRERRRIRTAARDWIRDVRRSGIGGGAERLGAHVCESGRRLPFRRGEGSRAWLTLSAEQGYAVDRDGARRAQGAARRPRARLQLADELRHDRAGSSPPASPSR